MKLILFPYIGSERVKAFIPSRDKSREIYSAVSQLEANRYFSLLVQSSSLFIGAAHILPPFLSFSVSVSLALSLQQSCVSGNTLAS